MSQIIVVVSSRGRRDPTHVFHFNKSKTRFFCVWDWVSHYAGVASCQLRSSTVFYSITPRIFTMLEIGF
jgi:hypothetical protein